MMKTIIERIDAGRVSEELARRGIEPGRAVRVTVETVDEAPLEIGGLLDNVRRLGHSSGSTPLHDDTLDEILRDVESNGC